MRDAWERGVVLGGVSAGSICWHDGRHHRLVRPRPARVTNGLGLLPYANGVHYDSEEQRRPLVQSLVADGTLGTTYCTDDYVGILYEGTEPVEVVTDRPATYRTGPWPTESRAGRTPSSRRRSHPAPSDPRTTHSPASGATNPHGHAVDDARSCSAMYGTPAARCSSTLASG